MISSVKSASKYLALAVAAMVLTGCASGGITSDWRGCAIAGAVAAGGVSAGQDTDHELAYAAGGAIVAGTLCAIFGEDPDSDGDGVPDKKDLCPNTPKGVSVDVDGCPVDSDGDGVPDYLDKCPNTPPGIAVDVNGCPGDDDKDGVPNYLDKCPDTPRGAEVDAVGCALVTVLENIDFDFDSAKLTPTAIAELDLLIAREQDLEAKHGILELAGHTDSIGNDDYNMALSERRAQSIVDYMGSHGLPADRLIARGYGETQPMADNGTEDGRALNRRVELRYMHDAE